MWTQCFEYSKLVDDRNGPNRIPVFEYAIKHAIPAFEIRLHGAQARLYSSYVISLFRICRGYLAFGQSFPIPQIFLGVRCRK